MSNEVDAPPGFTPSGNKIGDIVNSPPAAAPTPQAGAVVDAPPGYTSKGAKVGDIVDAPPGMGSQGAAAPNPIATPHTYDDPISQAAKKHGIDINLLRAVGMQETGLGGASNFDPKTGLDKDGNPGHGLFQLDPASGASRETLDRAAKDPKFAADYAAGMMSNLLKKYGGNERKALAAYNAGNPASSAGQTYADSVLHFMGSMDSAQLPADAPVDHKDLGAETVKTIGHVVKRMQAATRAGKNPFGAIAQDPAIRPVADWSRGLSQAMLYLREHPVESGFNVLGAGQHGVGETLHELAKRGGVSALHDLWDNSPVHQQVFKDVQNAVFHPNAKSSDDATFGLAEFVNASAHKDIIPSHNDIDNFVKQHIWGPLQGPAAGAMKMTEDLVLQTITDPLTYAGGLGLFEKGGRAGSAVARAAYASLPAEAKKFFEPLMNIATALEDTSGRVFGVRRDLDQAGFTREGKKARIAIENAELSRHSQNIRDIKANAHDGNDAADLYLKLSKSGPKQSTSAVHNTVTHLADASTDPAERESILRKMASTVRDQNIANTSAKHVLGKPHLYTGDAATLSNLGTEENSRIQKILDLSKPVVDPVRNLGRRAIAWNFVPHGLRNVGTSVFLGGGLPAVMHGLGAMATGVGDAEVSRLRNMGALPDYLQEELKTGAGPLGKLTQASQHGLEHVELGWRAGVLRQLDRQLGKPKDELDEYMRGYMVNHMVGDYRNQSALVKAFSALGGPFVAFRLGIVPRTFMKTLATHPERINRILEMEHDTNDNRDSRGKQVSTLEGGGPVSDMMSLWADPQKYLANTLGMLGQAGHEAPVNAGLFQQLFSHANDIAASYIPEIGAAEKIDTIATGVERPKQEPTLTQRLEDVILEMFGQYYKENKTPKQEAKEAKEIRTGGF
jgi:hypothetical protein